MECGLGSRLGPTPLECGLGPRLERGLGPTPVECGLGARLGSRLGAAPPTICNLGSPLGLGSSLVTLPRDGRARLLSNESFYLRLRRAFTSELLQHGPIRAC